MTDQMRQKLERLRAVAPRLNETTNEAARVVQAVEKFLAGLSLGISVDRYLSDRPAEARPDVDPDEDRGREAIETRLAYGKFAGSFRFFVRETLIRQNPYDSDRWDDVEVLNEQAWSSCTREVKLAAFAELPALLGQIVTKAEKLASGADEAARTVGELLSALGYTEPEARNPDTDPDFPADQMADAKLELQKGGIEANDSLATLYLGIVRGSDEQRSTAETFLKLEGREDVLRIASRDRALFKPTEVSPRPRTR